jgi:hypothetical protein
MLAFADWGPEEYIIFSVPFVLIAITALVFVLFRRTLRTRVRVGIQLRDDPDINEWLIIYNWSRKVLYTPFIVVSFIAAAVMLLITLRSIEQDPAAQIVGGIWLLVFFVSFLIEEYEMSLKVLAIVVLFLLLLALWLQLLDWLMGFLRLFKYVSVSMSWLGFLLIGMIFAVGVIIAWVRGLFYYVAITPNYLNIQIGPTETGEQIAREDYSTRVDTSDFLERMLGFGRIVITFRDSRRLPMMLLVGRIGRKAQMLESIRGKLAVDRHQSIREGGTGDL